MQDANDREDSESQSGGADCEFTQWASDWTQREVEKCLRVAFPEELASGAFDQGAVLTRQVMHNVMEIILRRGGYRQVQGQPVVWQPIVYSLHIPWQLGYNGIRVGEASHPWPGKSGAKATAARRRQRRATQVLDTECFPPNQPGKSMGQAERRRQGRWRRRRTDHTARDEENGQGQGKRRGAAYEERPRARSRTGETSQGARKTLKASGRSSLGRTRSYSCSGNRIGTPR